MSANPWYSPGVTRPLFFLGDGGYAHEVALIADLVDPQQQRWDTHVFLGPDDEAAALAHGGAVALAIGTPSVRLALLERYSTRADLTWPELVHPRADIGPRVTIGPGTCVCSGTIITTNVTVESGVLLNLNVTVGHDSVIGAGSVLNPGVAISGGAHIGAGCMIGVGAIVLEHISVGAGATVGAGSVVVKDVAPGDTVVGIPARAIRSSTT